LDTGISVGDEEELNASGKPHQLFWCLSGLSKEHKDQKEWKDERHLVFLMPSPVTKISHILLLKDLERQVCFSEDSLTCKSPYVFSFFFLFFSYVFVFSISYVFLFFSISRVFSYTTVTL
jgi:hypothetical protein